MKCLKCGAEVEDTSKFCGYCGNPLQVDNIGNENANSFTNTVKEDMPATNQVFKENEQEQEVTMEQKEILPLENNENLQVETKQEENKPEKKSVKNNTKKWIFIVCGVLLAVIASVLLILAFNKSSNASIDILEKAIRNTISKGKDSGTITANILVEDDSQNINLSGAFKYQKENDSYKFAVNVDKSMFFDEINLFATVDKNNLSLYAKSGLIDMFMGTSSQTDNWLKYSYDFEEMKDSFEDLKTNKEINLSNLGLDKYFKFIKKENGLRHYTFTINKKLIDELKNKMTSEEKEEYDMMLSMIPSSSELLEKGYNIDFYINEKDELEKIAIDVTKFLEENEVKKAIFSLQFKDFNNTIVNIPEEAKNGIDFETYMSENMPSGDYGFEYDDYDDSDFDFDYEDDNMFDFSY